MPRWILLVAVAGCSFDPQGAGTDGTDGTDGAVQPPLAGCTASGDGVVLCLEFQDATSPMPNVLLDTSGRGHDARPTAIVSTERDGDPAIRLTALAGSKLDVPATGDLDLTDRVTMELWFRSDFGPPPTGTRHWLVDHDGQYFLSIGSNRQVQCGFGNRTLDSSTTIDVDTERWQHVACTIDAAKADHEIRIYLDGSVRACKKYPDAIASRPGGTTIGMRSGFATVAEQFVGSLDGVHVYDRALSAEEICDAAGKRDCHAECE